MAKPLNADRQDRAARPGTNGPETNGRPEGRRAPESAPRPAPKRLSGIRAAGLAQEQLEQLIQRPCEAVSGLSRHGEGWMITLEVVELERVPPTTDILATYRVELDQDGELMGYDRVSRYYRNQAGGADS